MLRFLVASLVLLLAGVFLFPWQTSAAELLSNGGFESGTDGWGWTFGQLDTVASPGHGGGSAARLESSALQAHEVYQFLDVQHDSAYEFSGWVLMNDADVQRVFLRVNWFDGEGSPVSATDSSWLTIPDAGYQRLSSGSVVSPSAARTARVEAWIQANGPFTVYLDDFSMAGAVQVPETATPAVTPAPTGPPVTPRPSANPTPRATRPPGADEETPPPEDAAPDPTVFDQLVNGGFEELAQDGSPYGWRDIGADIASLEGASAEGSRALQVVSLTSSTKWAYQTVRVEGGSVYEGGAYAMNTDGGEL